MKIDLLNFSHFTRLLSIIVQIGYEVSAILDHCIDDSGSFLFLIDWKGFRTKTWEPLINLDRCKLSLKKYIERIRSTADDQNQIDDLAFKIFQSQKTLKGRKKLKHF